MTVQYTPRITAKTYYEVRINQTLIDGLNKYDITDGLANKTNWTTGVVAIDKSLFRVEVINSNGSVTSPEVVMINNFTYGFISTDMTGATVSVRYDGDLGVKDVITPSYNFDLTMDWSILLDNNGNPYPVTNQATFTQWLMNGMDSFGEVQNDFTNIIITDFIKVGNNIKCNLTATATTFALNNNIIVNLNKIGIINGLIILYLNGNQLSNFNPTIPLPISLQTLALDSNQLTSFNPTIALPSSLQTLNLDNNQIVTFNPTIALPSSLQYLVLGNNQIVTFNPTIALPSSLQTLYLQGNQIVTFNPTIPLPSSLQYLVLDNNQIVTFNPTIPLPSSFQTLYLQGNQIVTFNPTIALPNSFQSLYLQSNQIVTFNPTIPLPNSLQTLGLNNNKFTLAGYTATEPWANSLSISTGKNVTFNNNLSPVSGTNLQAILISKGWTVFA